MEWVHINGQIIYIKIQKKAKIYSIPDSGLFLTNYYSPIIG